MGSQRIICEVLLSVSRCALGTSNWAVHVLRRIVESKKLARVHFKGSLNINQLILDPNIRSLRKCPVKIPFKVNGVPGNLYLGPAVADEQAS